MLAWTVHISSWLLQVFFISDHDSPYNPVATIHSMVTCLSPRLAKAHHGKLEVCFQKTKNKNKIKVRFKSPDIDSDLVWRNCKWVVHSCSKHALHLPRESSSWPGVTGKGQQVGGGITLPARSEPLFTTNTLHLPHTHCVSHKQRWQPRACSVLSPHLIAWMQNFICIKIHVLTPLNLEDFISQEYLN